MGQTFRVLLVCQSWLPTPCPDLFAQTAVRQAVWPTSVTNEMTKWSYGMLNVHRVHVYLQAVQSATEEWIQSVHINTAFWTQCTTLPADLAEVAIQNLQTGQIVLLLQGHQNIVCGDCDNSCRSMFSKQTVNTVCRAQPSRHGSFWGYRRTSD